MAAPCTARARVRPQGDAAVAGRARIPAAGHARVACGAPNQALQRLLAVGARPKLALSTPGDAYEREADRVADAVMSGARVPAPGAAPSGPAQVQRKCAACEEEDLTVRREAAGAAVPTTAPGALVPGAGSPLSASLRTFFEPRFGRDFGHVRVHTGERAAQIADSLQARAFTQGRHIVFGSGEYGPETASGRHLLAHELAHTVQARAAGDLVQRRVRANLVSCRNPSAALQAIVGADPVATLEAANARAIAMLDTAIDELQTTREAIVGGEAPTPPTVADSTATALQARMRIDSSNRAVWTGSGVGSVPLLIRRLRLVRNLLNGGSVAYTCVAGATINTPTCAGPACGGATRAASCEGLSRLFLCTPFWTDSADDQAATLMHECFHVFFGFVGDVGHEGNAHCYEQLVFDLNTVAVNPAFAASCPP